MNPLPQTTRTTLVSREASPRTTWERDHLTPQKVLRIEKWVLPGQTQEKRQSTPPGHLDRKATSRREYLEAHVEMLSLTCVRAESNHCPGWLLRLESPRQVPFFWFPRDCLTTHPSFISTSLAKKEESCRHGPGNVSPPSISPGPPGSHLPGKTAEEPGSGDRFS